MPEKEKFNKIKYNNQFIAEKYDRVNLTMPKGQKERVKAAADAAGQSVNAFVLDAVDEKIERGSKG